jgi:hypothetical protein
MIKLINLKVINQKFIHKIINLFKMLIYLISIKKNIWKKGKNKIRDPLVEELK